MVHLVSLASSFLLCDDSPEVLIINVAVCCKNCEVIDNLYVLEVTDEVITDIRCIACDLETSKLNIRNSTWIDRIYPDFTDRPFLIPDAGMIQVNNTEYLIVGNFSLYDVIYFSISSTTKSVPCV